VPAAARDWSCARRRGPSSSSPPSQGPRTPAQLNAQASLSQALDVLEAAPRGRAAQGRFREASEGARARHHHLQRAPRSRPGRLDVDREIALAAIVEADRLRPDRKYAEALEAMEGGRPSAIRPTPATSARWRWSATSGCPTSTRAAALRRGRADGPPATGRPPRDRYPRRDRHPEAAGRAEGLARYSDAMGARQPRPSTSTTSRAPAAAFKEAVGNLARPGRGRAGRISRLKVRARSGFALVSLLLMAGAPGRQPRGPAPGARCSPPSPAWCTSTLANHAYDPRGGSWALTAPSEKPAQGAGGRWRSRTGPSCRPGRRPACS